MMENPLWIVVFAFVLAAVPLFVCLGTSYVKVHIVLGMLRNGLGTQNVPGTMVVAALSLAVTGVVMEPVIEETLQILDSADLDSINEPFDLLKSDVVGDLLAPWKEFIGIHAGKKEKKVFARLKQYRNDSADVPHDQLPIADESFGVILPAFIVSELKEAFAMAFSLLLPFLVIDIVVSNILVGLGMFMVSPVLISLPLKLMIFVFADGWLLLVHGLVKSYQLGG